jgi:hypothetical protein
MQGDLTGQKLPGRRIEKKCRHVDVVAFGLRPPALPAPRADGVAMTVGQEIGPDTEAKILSH